MTTISRFRFLERTTSIFPRDDVGSLADAPAFAGDSLPFVVETGLAPYGREFGPGLSLNPPEVEALDLRRSLTIRVLLSYDLKAHADGDKGVIIHRSDAFGTTFSLSITRDDAAFGTIKLSYDDVSGDAGTTGFSYEIPLDHFYLAVTREWVSTAGAVIRYYINGVYMFGETTTLAETGASGIGTTLIGRGLTGDHLPTGATFHCLAIDDKALSPEEIAHEFELITTHMFDGAEVLSDYLPVGTAYSKDFDSNFQKLIAALSVGLGDHSASAKNFLDNALPDRAYGDQLSSWEDVFLVAPGKHDLIDERRRVLLGRLQQHRGYTIQEMAKSLEPGFGLAAEDVVIIEPGPTRTDDFSVDDTVGPSRIWLSRYGNGSTITISGGVCTCAFSAAENGTSYQHGGDAPFRETSLSGHVDGAIFSIDITVNGTVAPGAIAGLTVRSVEGEALWYGYADNPTKKLYYSHDDSPVTNIAAVMPDILAIRYLGGDQYSLGYLDTSGNFQETVTVTGPGKPRWCGFGVIDIDKSGGTSASCGFKDFNVYEPSGARTLNWFAYRSPALAGEYDLESAQQQIFKQGPAHAHGVAIDDLEGFKCGTGRVGVDALYPAGLSI